MILAAFAGLLAAWHTPVQPKATCYPHVKVVVVRFLGCAGGWGQAGSGRGPVDVLIWRVVMIWDASLDAGRWHCLYACTLAVMCGQLCTAWCCTWTIPCLFGWALMMWQAPCQSAIPAVSRAPRRSRCGSLYPAQLLMWFTQSRLLVATPLRLHGQPSWDCCGILRHTSRNHDAVLQLLRSFFISSARSATASCAPRPCGARRAVPRPNGAPSSAPCHEGSTCCGLRQYWGGHIC